MNYAFCAHPNDDRVCGNFECFFLKKVQVLQATEMRLDAKVKWDLWPSTSEWRLQQSTTEWERRVVHYTHGKKWLTIGDAAKEQFNYLQFAFFNNKKTQRLTHYSTLFQGRHSCSAQDTTFMVIYLFFYYEKKTQKHERRSQFASLRRRWTITVVCNVASSSSSSSTIRHCKVSHRITNRQITQTKYFMACKAYTEAKAKLTE